LSFSWAGCGHDSNGSLDAGGFDAADDAAAVRDGGSSGDSDAGPRPDGSREDAGADAALADAGAPRVCGSARPDLEAITFSESIVIARDGTIFYSQPGGVGRLAPARPADHAWVSVGKADATVWGLALDVANENLYVASPATAAIHRVVLADAVPVALVFVADAGAPNGMTLGPDGALYYSDSVEGHVYRVTLGGDTGTAVRVTVDTIPSPTGLAFFADGSLLVASYSTGDLVRLELAGGAESGRTLFASVGMFAGTEGVALDAEGRVYVTHRMALLTRFAADGSAREDIYSEARAADIAFGTGTLDCEDIYIPSPRAGPMRRYEDGTTPGARLPWQ
jgi:sugar lactone lactonase YvrE